MQNQENSTQTIRKGLPWHKSGLTGEKPPLWPKHVRPIRTKLGIEGRARDLAMFDLAIDSRLGGCDVVAIKLYKIREVVPDGSSAAANSPQRRAPSPEADDCADSGCSMA
jgi:hypothetical protein